MQKKKILVVGQHYWPENFRITDMCEGFVANGYEVNVLCGIPNYPKGIFYKGYSYFKPRKEVHNGVNIYRSGEISRKGNTSIRIFLNYISFPIFATFNLFRFLGKSYDAVFCYQTSPVLMIFPAIIFSKVTKTPLITYVLDLWPENLYSVLNVKNNTLRNMCKSISHWHYNSNTRLIAMSKSLKEALVQNTKKEPKDIYIIPHYCENFYEEKLFDNNLTQRFSGKFKICFTGNFSPAQGLNVLIELAIKLKENNIQDVIFIMVGDGMSHNEFVNTVKQNFLEDYFVFEGQKDPLEMPYYLTLSDVLFASLSKTDFIGLTVPAKVTSYIASGKPILLCMDGEGPKLIEEIECGFSAPSENSKILYQQFLKLYNMPKVQLEKLGENAKEYHDKYLKRDIVLKELLKVINNEQGN